MRTLWGALEGLPDRRTRKGRRCELASIVGLSLAAMLSGADDPLAIHRFGRRLTPRRPFARSSRTTKSYAATQRVAE
jgi:hypothetical protein